MIRRPPRSTLSSSSAASDVYKRQRTTWSAVWTVRYHRGAQERGLRTTGFDHCTVMRSPRRTRPPCRTEAHRCPRHAVRPCTCLLYTSDAADEEDSVDLGGRRIIKKKKKKKKKNTPHQT